MPSEQPPTRVEKPRMALRPYHDDPERLDDVVVKDVAMFRAEMMDDGALWMACHFADPEADDLHFWATAGKTGRAQLRLVATDVPDHIDFDAAEPAQPPSEGQPTARVHGVTNATESGEWQDINICEGCGFPIRSASGECARGDCPAPPPAQSGVRELVETLRSQALQIRATRDGVFSDGMAAGLDQAASLAAQALRDEDAGNLTFACENCGHAMHKRPISGPEATGSVAAPESGEGLRLTEDAGRGPDRPASPTEQGEARAYPGGKP